MLYLALTLTIFVLTCFLHRLLYRTVGEKTIWGAKLYCVYLLGFLADGVIVMFILPRNLSAPFNWWNIQLPLSSLVFYLLLTALYFIFYMIAYLADTSPSTKIYWALGKQGKLSFEDLVRNFSDEVLIIKRLKEMELAGAIKQKEHKYKILPRGRTLLSILDSYRRILGWRGST